MKSFHVKKNEEVVMLAGAHKGKRGRIIAVLAKKQRVIVEGVAMIKRHLRKSQQHPHGAIIEREGSVHISNVMSATDFDARAARRSGAAAGQPAQ